MYEAVKVISATEISANHSPGKEKEIEAEDMSISDVIIYFHFLLYKFEDSSQIFLNL